MGGLLWTLPMTGQELRKRIWAKPLKDVARDLQWSAKKLRDMIVAWGISAPPPGYWNKRCKRDAEYRKGPPVPFRKLLKEIHGDEWKARAKELEECDYKKYMKSREWKIWRHKIIARDHYTCRRCGKQTRSLQVHHLHYRNGRYPRPADVETLCAGCHYDESKKSGHLKKQTG